ncbi:MAG: hypothetical protein RBT69_13085 [Spirochaetia bacterium]|jgi:hypothetical protein|nr:hypothetical protein [Spirochaetia bacterium]
MHKINAFTQEEALLVDKSADIFKEKGKDIYSNFLRQKKDLTILAELVSRTPSLRSGERHGMSKRDINTMAETLSLTGTANPLLLPTRATMGRSFILTKINFFSFITKILMTIEANTLLAKEIQFYRDKLVFSLMAEKAYEAIIENEIASSVIIKAAADELSFLWEYRMDRNLDSFSPPLMALWKERCKAVPVLGTLQGTMEVLRISINLPDIWGDFLSSAAGIKNSMEQALEEFVFGLSFEEITHLRQIMESSNISAIDREKAVEILKKENLYKEKHGIFLQGDAREIYSFFHIRNENAVKRKLQESPGPRQTIEELFLIYLLEIKREDFKSVIKKSFSKLLKVFKK